MSYGLRSNNDAQSVANLVTTINNLSNSTSYFSKKEKNALKFEYENVNTFDEFNNKISCTHVDIPEASPLYINNRDYSTFTGCSNLNFNSIDSLSDDEKQFAILLDQVLLNEIVVRGTDESKTDTFIDYVLREVGLGKFPLAIRLKPIYMFTIRHKTISSEYDFSVEKKGKLLMVEEDKHIRNTGPGSSWGEYQLAGEMIAGAFENYNKFAIESEIFSVRAIGARFTFYYTVIPATYLASLSSGLPEESIIIYRYPPQSKAVVPPGLDYTKAEDRRVIISILYRIKSSMINCVNEL